MALGASKSAAEERLKYTKSINNLSVAKSPKMHQSQKARATARVARVGYFVSSAVANHSSLFCILCNHRIYTYLSTRKRTRHTGGQEKLFVLRHRSQF